MRRKEELERGGTRSREEGIRGRGGRGGAQEEDTGLCEELITAALPSLHLPDKPCLSHKNPLTDFQSEARPRLITYVSRAHLGPRKEINEV